MEKCKKGIQNIAQNQSNATNFFDKSIQKKLKNVIM